MNSKMSLTHHLRTTGRVPVFAAKCGFSVHRQRYLQTTLTSQHVSAYLTIISFVHTVNWLLSTSTSPNHAIFKGVTKSANVHHRSFWEPQRFLPPTSSTRTFASTTTPRSTDTRGVKKDRDTSGLFSDIEKSIQTFNKRAVIQFPITCKTIDKISPRSNLYKHQHLEQLPKYTGNKTQSPGSREYVADCGRHYARQGDKKNHESDCVKCKRIKKQEKERKESHRRLVDWVKGLVVSKLKPNTVSGPLDAKHDILNYVQKRKPQEIDRNTAQLLHVELSRVATSKLTPCDEQGYIYILRDSESGLLKIGFAKDPRVRIKQHNKCGRDLKAVYVSECIKWTKRAERLIKLDLKHLCRPWFCSSCQQRHGEYFEITEERAKATVEKWEDWINSSQPYSSDGSIIPLWKYLILFHRTPKQAMRAYDHEARWAHWSWVLSPASEDDLRDFQDNFEQHGFGHHSGLMLPREKSDQTMERDNFPKEVLIERI